MLVSVKGQDVSVFETSC